MRFILTLLLMNFAFWGNAQALGAKKVLVLQFHSFECGDYCHLEMKDVKNGETYMLSEMYDEKTIFNGIFEEIENAYYKNNNNSKFKSKLYSVILEYRKTDEIIMLSPEEPARKTGKKIQKWMLNSIIRK